MHYLAKGDPYFTLEQLSGATVPVWDVIISEKYKKTLRSRIERVVDNACQNEFIDSFHRAKDVSRRKNTPTWRITYNPSKLPFDKRSREYQRLETMQREFIEALRTGKRKPQQLMFPL